MYVSGICKPESFVEYRVRLYRKCACDEKKDEKKDEKLRRYALLLIIVYIIIIIATSCMQ